MFYVGNVMYLCRVCVSVSVSLSGFGEGGSFDPMMSVARCVRFLFTLCFHWAPA